MLPSMEIVGEAEDGREAVEQGPTAASGRDFDGHLHADLNGFDATARILRVNPRIRVLILTMYEEEEVITRCLTAGASGYLLKDAPRADVDPRHRHRQAGRPVLKLTSAEESGERTCPGRKKTLPRIMNA